jgi:hypothetical protein
MFNFFKRAVRNEKAIASNIAASIVIGDRLTLKEIEELYEHESIVTLVNIELNSYCKKISVTSRGIFVEKCNEII